MLKHLSIVFILINHFLIEGALSPSSEVCSGDTELSSPTQNSTDEEKLLGRTYQRLAPSRSNPPTTESLQLSFSLDNRSVTW